MAGGEHRHRQLGHVRRDGPQLLPLRRPEAEGPAAVDPLGQQHGVRHQPDGRTAGSRRRPRTRARGPASGRRSPSRSTAVHGRDDGRPRSAAPHSGERWPLLQKIMGDEVYAARYRTISLRRCRARSSSRRSRGARASCTRWWRPMSAGRRASGRRTRRSAHPRRSRRRWTARRAVRARAQAPGRYSRGAGEIDGATVYLPTRCGRSRLFSLQTYSSSSSSAVSWNSWSPSTAVIHLGIVDRDLDVQSAKAGAAMRSVTVIASECGWPASSSQVLSLNPTVRTTSVSPSQRPVEYPSTSAVGPSRGRARQGRFAGRWSASCTAPR